MASEFENIHDLDDLNDRELRDLVRSHLRAHNGLDADYITVRTEEGAVILEGRVGTDYERRVAEHVLTDVLGVADVRNDLVVDAIHRAERPNYHGHSYVCEVTVRGEIDARTGMLVDVAKLDGALALEVRDRFDHRNINLDVPEFAEGKLVPTGENLARFIYERLGAALRGSAK